jgi:predicted RNase H-like nuclease (RuvC/YqgF family)
VRKEESIKKLEARIQELEGLREECSSENKDLKDKLAELTRLH